MTAKLGKIISLEGIEGSGKSTQKKHIEEHLQKLGYQVLSLREPGGTDLGEQIRDILLSLPKDTDPLTEALLFATSRAELIQRKILPFLKEKKTIVLLDRFMDSSIVYQGIAGGLNIDWVKSLHQVKPLDLRPDLTLYYQISLETSMKRQEQRGNQKDYFESKPSSYYQKLIQGFNDLAEQEADRIKIINGEQDLEAVFKESIAHLESLLI